MFKGEFSKRLLVFIEILIVITYILVVIATVMGHIDALVAFIGGIFSLASISFSFYYWKAKNENIRKYSKKLSMEDVEKVAKCYDAIFRKVEEGEDE